MWCWLGPCSIWCLQGLACVLPWPGGVGGGPIWAPSQNLPLPLVTATSLLCLAWVQPPHISPLRGAAPPSKSPRTGRRWLGLGPLQSSVSSSGNKKDWPLCAFRSCPSRILRTPESLHGCLHFLHSTPMGRYVYHPSVAWASAWLCTHREVALSLNLSSSPIKWSDTCSDSTSLPVSQTDHRQVSESNFRTMAPNLLSLVLSLFFVVIIVLVWGFFGLFEAAGLFSSLRHHLAHHSARPRRPQLAPAVCQGVLLRARAT